jgi:hypothetical protein
MSGIASGVKWRAHDRDYLLLYLPRPVPHAPCQAQVRLLPLAQASVIIGVKCVPLRRRPWRQCEVVEEKRREHKAKGRRRSVSAEVLADDAPAQGLRRILVARADADVEQAERWLAGVRNVRELSDAIWLRPPGVEARLVGDSAVAAAAQASAS